MVANNGEAIELFDNSQFDVILMDMQMPVMGGAKWQKLSAQERCGVAGLFHMNSNRFILLR